jgi:polyphosphate glucokinase
MRVLRGPKQEGPFTACVDVGATSLKAALVDTEGTLASERAKVRTTWPMTPQKLVEEVARLVVRLPSADRLALGFPGVIRDGVVLSGSNLERAGGPGTPRTKELASAWRGFDLQRRLSATFEIEARVANDADVAALACSTGKGLELTVALGTGFGTGLTLEGILLPHVEYSQLRWSRRQTFDDVLGEHARKRDGEEKWHDRVIGALHLVHEVLGFDSLHLAGGNAPRIHRDDLGELQPITTVSQTRPGILGGYHLYVPNHR